MNTNKLSAFTKAYIECALWSSTDEDGEPLDREYSVNDIAPETMAKMIADCADFEDACAEMLGIVYELGGYDAERAGHDFWLTRNRHGAGFWDRGLSTVGKDLTDMAHPYGSFDLYIGDDGKVHGQ